MGKSKQITGKGNGAIAGAKNQIENTRQYLKQTRYVNKCRDFILILDGLYEDLHYDDSHVADLQAKKREICSELRRFCRYAKANKPDTFVIDGFTAFKQDHRALYNRLAQFSDYSEFTDDQPSEKMVGKGNITVQIQPVHEASSVNRRLHRYNTRSTEAIDLLVAYYNILQSPANERLVDIGSDRKIKNTIRKYLTRLYDDSLSSPPDAQINYFMQFASVYYREYAFLENYAGWDVPDD